MSIHSLLSYARACDRIIRNGLARSLEVVRTNAVLIEAHAVPVGKQRPLPLPLLLPTAAATVATAARCAPM